MFDLKNMKNISSINIYFDSEDLDLEIEEPMEIITKENGVCIITDNSGYTFIIRPTWNYISVKTKKPEC